MKPAKIQPYHKYVFDFDKREFVGQFDTMYEREEEEGYDSWWCSDLTHLAKQIHLAVLAQFNFGTIFDYGCGKGVFTHLLKKRNNHVIGADVSSVAIEKARIQYGKIVEFHVVEGNNFSFLGRRKMDLTLCIEVFGLVADWRDVLISLFSVSRYVYISQYVPDNPIGFVKSMGEVEAEMKRHSDVVEKLVWNNQSLFILGRNKKE